MKFRNCLLASDVDGTLMEQGRISPRNFDAINKFVSEGGTFCIATGRCPAAMKHIVSQFKSLHNIIYYNGGMIYDCTNQKVLINKILDDSDKFFLKNVTDKFPELGLEVYSGDQVFMVRYSDSCRVHFEYEYIDIVPADIEEIKNLKWNKAMTFYPTEYDDSCIEKEIEKTVFKKCEFAKAAGYIDGKNYRGYEQLPLGANKGSALIELADLLNIPRNRTFAIGDYYNDLEMLKEAGISACPKESPNDIKHIVDFVAGACSDGAVADFIEYLTTVDL